MKKERDENKEAMDGPNSRIPLDDGDGTSGSSLSELDKVETNDDEKEEKRLYTYDEHLMDVPDSPYEVQDPVEPLFLDVFF